MLQFVSVSKTDQLTTEHSRALRKTRAEMEKKRHKSEGDMKDLMNVISAEAEAAVCNTHHH